MNIALVENNGLLISQKPLLVPGQGMVQINNVPQFPGRRISSEREAYLIVDGKPLLAVSRVSSDQGTGGYFEGLP